MQEQELISKAVGMLEDTIYPGGPPISELPGVDARCADVSHPEMLSIRLGHQNVPGGSVGLILLSWKRPPTGNVVSHVIRYREVGSNDWYGAIPAYISTSTDPEIAIDTIIISGSGYPTINIEELELTNHFDNGCCSRLRMHVSCIGIHEGCTFNVTSSIIDMCEEIQSLNSQAFISLLNPIQEVDIE